MIARLSEQIRRFSDCVDLYYEYLGEY